MYIADILPVLCMPSQAQPQQRQESRRLRHNTLAARAMRTFCANARPCRTDEIDTISGIARPIVFRFTLERTEESVAISASSRNQQRGISSRMLKKSAGIVLAPLRGSTYRRVVRRGTGSGLAGACPCLRWDGDSHQQKGGSPRRSLRPCWTAHFEHPEIDYPGFRSKSPWLLIVCHFDRREKSVLHSLLQDFSLRSK